MILLIKLLICHKKKILVKLSYLNMSLMQKGELILILRENEFNKMFLEFEGLQKGL